ncbi:T9SS type A sorting domain-containing protein [Maribacter polysaccharolyticus]|uniref:T9SS type A sorting domain-containing protein n=1 Tax=Maribacter polysaccharolyticus TaxID=3020831 RepID=UPI00237F6E10|nr:T9SS type A sorting domain-containing protein [Maribacter polysaccharolyticus]MDE3742985.1 T9SS type A sorting domain-containing protein [Maribacter polysaccharolyticus]
MEKLYFAFFFLFITLGFAQDVKPNGDIMEFKLYPNPVTNGKVYIITETKAPKKIHIYDVLGTQVMQTTLLREELNVSELDAGVYVLRVYQKDKVATRKLIVK